MGRTRMTTIAPKIQVPFAYDCTHCEHLRVFKEGVAIRKRKCLVFGQDVSRPSIGVYHIKPCDDCLAMRRAKRNGGNKKG